MTSTHKPGDRHKIPAIVVRPDPDVRAKGAATLEEHDWTMTEFISACLDLVHRNPAAMLGSLAKFKPARRKGRPPKTKT